MAAASSQSLIVFPKGLVDACGGTQRFTKESSKSGVKFTCIQDFPVKIAEFKGPLLFGLTHDKAPYIAFKVNVLANERLIANTLQIVYLNKDLGCWVAIGYGPLTGYMLDDKSWKPLSRFMQNEALECERPGVLFDLRIEFHQLQELVKYQDVKYSILACTY